jgi:2-dehydro-3-deoxy-D-arabinonate dehydratase
LPRETAIELRIARGGAEIFSGATSLTQMKRTFPELAGWLFRDNEFPAGCFLLTGTGLVPGGDFTLGHGDEVAIHVAGIGTLRNWVE